MLKGETEGPSRRKAHETDQEDSSGEQTFLSPGTISLSGLSETVQELIRRLEPLGMKIARREVLYLFEAYCTLLRASSEVKDEVEWLLQVEKNGGIIVSVDGILEDEEQRDGLRGTRCAHGAGAGCRECDVVGDGGDKGAARPGGGVESEGAGTITDAQERELLAVEELWPTVPHQVCQFHVLRDAPKAAFETDKQVKTAMRKRLQRHP